MYHCSALVLHQHQLGIVHILRLHGILQPLMRCGQKRTNVSDLLEYHALLDMLPQVWSEPHSAILGKQGWPGGNQEDLVYVSVLKLIAPFR